MSPSNIDKFLLLDHLSSSDNVQVTELYNEREWMRDWSETKADDHKSQLPGEDALFSQYLRSPSPSCSSAKGDSSYYDHDGESPSQTVAPRDLCFCTDEDPYPAELIDQRPAPPKKVPVTTKKPQITLRIDQPKPPPQAKVMLRLSQPKRTPAQRPVRPGLSNRRRRRT